MTNNYFLTGGTGVIGSALVPLLLEDVSSRIWLLMRAESPTHLQQRFQELITFWGMSEEQAQDARRRIIPLIGDTDQPQFALSQDVYAEIARQCTHIIHCAGVVRMNLPLQTARAHALGAAKNVVELALAGQAAGQLQKVEYVSTVGVAGRMRGVVPETWITEPRAFHNTYEQSKAEAEDYLREQIQLHQLPVTVHRPSMVVGDSKTGKIIHYQIFYHICEFLSGRRTFGLLPYLGAAVVDTVPVDHVALTIKFSADKQDMAGKIMHICSGKEAIKLTALRRLVRETMRRHRIKAPLLVSLPITLFNAMVMVISPLLSADFQRAVKAFPFFLNYLGDDQMFDNKVALRMLKSMLGNNDLLSGSKGYIVNSLDRYFDELQREC